MVKNELYLSRVTINVSRFVGYLYTAKLAKTVLVNILPGLLEHFKPSTGPKPKLVHISPLYINSHDGKTRCIYSYALCKGEDLIKCNESPKPVVLEGTYNFYFGFHTQVLTPGELLSSITERGSMCFNFMSQRVCTEIMSVDIRNEYTRGRELARKVLEAGSMKIVFSSPTMLRDPLRTSGKFKTLLPSPFNVFATPVYTILFSKGLSSVRRLRTELLRLHRLFNETYSALGGVKVRWVYYGRRPEPALVGYVNYRVNFEYFDFLKQGLNVEDWLGEIFAYMLALGVGAGRAAGFGHVELKPLAERKNTGEPPAKSL
ncbi:MAG: CRISPR system precrRNA processing endoribonuclease RAMP protein Cas6 [Desulfurococcaceae archaeon]